MITYLLIVTVLKFLSEKMITKLKQDIYFLSIDNTIEDKLIEIEINTVHKECKKLQDKYNKLNNQLLDVQFEMFCLSSI